MRRSAETQWRAQQEANEVRESRESRETLRRFGDAYRGVIDMVNGETELGPDTSTMNAEDRAFVERMVDVANRNKERQASIMADKNLTVEQLLKPILRVKNVSLAPEELDDFQMEEVSGGMYQLRVPVRTYEKVMRGARAVAVTPRGEDAVSFVIQPIHERADDQAREDKENVPHETHHVLWRWMQRDGMTKNEEKGAFARRAFEMYRDEMMARAVSDGTLFGYTHMQQLSPEQRDVQREEHGEEAARVESTVDELNELFHDLQVGLLQRETDWTHRDLVRLIWKSSSFEVLQTKAQAVRAEVLTSPEKPKPQSDVVGGWGFISA